MNPTKLLKTPSLPMILVFVAATSVLAMAVAACAYGA
jgi:hypothetical protein